MKLVLAALIAAGFGSLAVAQEQFAVLKGTVFTSEGRSLPGAKVVIEALSGEEKTRKKLRRETFTDRMGEFAARFPAGPSKYRLTAKASGFKDEVREIEFSGDERLDVSIVLKK